MNSRERPRLVPLLDLCRQAFLSLRLQPTRCRIAITNKPMASTGQMISM